MKKRLLVFILSLIIVHTGFAQCAGPVSASVSPPPVNGTYYPGEVVTFCFTEDTFAQIGENWFHAMTLNIGPGWDLSTLSVISVPQPTSGSGSWNYYPNGIVSYASGRHLGPGFYFGSDAGALHQSFAADSNNPGENFGDNCPTSCSWTFCFSIQVSLTAPFGTNLSLSATPGGDYLTGAWNGSGCTSCDSDSLIHTSPISDTTSVGHPVFLPIFTPKNVSCNGLCDASIKVVGYFGTPPYTYKWSNGSTDTLISNLCPGTYNVTVKDANDSIAIGSQLIVQPTPLTVTDSIVNPICDSMCNGAVIVNVAGGTLPYNYTWSTIPVQTASVAYGLCAGATKLTVTDNNGCPFDTAYLLVNPPPLSISLQRLTAILCYGSATGRIEVAASGGNTGPYSYVWSNNDSSSIDSFLTAGTYSVKVTDILGCETDSTYKLTQPANRLIPSPDVTSPACNTSTNGAISVITTGGTAPLTYAWVDSATNTTLSGSNITNLAPGLYWFTVTDANGCKVSDSVQLNPPPVLVIDSIPFVAPSCNGGSNGRATIIAHGGTGRYSYNWQNYPQDTFSSVKNLAAGITGVTVTDANKCAASSSIDVTQPDPITLTVINSHGALCAGENNGTITVSAAGGTSGYNYEWDNRVVGITDTALGASTATVTVTDANNCTVQRTFNIAQPQPLVTNPIIQNALCFQAANGYINANVNGGTAPYFYSWSNGQHDSVALALTIGVYSCTITDVDGCTTTTTNDSIKQPTLLVDSTYSTPVKCFGQKSGTISITASGGTPPYSFTATKDKANFYSPTNGTILGLDTGTYLVIINDSLGCENEKTAYVGNATADNFLITLDSTTCYGSNYNDGSALATYTSLQNAPYQFSIDYGIAQDTGYFQNLSAGKHSIIATNKNGCNDTLPVLIAQPLPVVVNITPDSLELPLGQKGNVQVTTLNATNPSFTWNGDAVGLSCADCPNPVVSPFVNTDYTVAVSMVNYNSTCYGYGTLHVSIIAPPAFFIPNAFSPNGDGVNDFFTVYGEGVASVELNVFNRWGELVYESNNSLSGWDGTYKGEMQPNGVYAYVAVVTLLDNTKTKRAGSIALMR